MGLWQSRIRLLQNLSTLGLTVCLECRYVVDIQESALSQARCRRPKFRPGQVERCARMSKQPVYWTRPWL